MATQPVSTVNQTITLPPGETTMSFSTADIKGMALSDDRGGLIITFNDGHQLTIGNFQDLASHDAHIALQDGSSIDAKHLYETLASELPPLNIGEPAAGQSVIYTMLPGQHYTIGFDLHQPGLHATEKSGALVITFGDHGQVILQNVAAATHIAADHQPQLAYDGKDISLADFLKDVQLAGILDLHHNAANSNDLAQAAQALANEEPGAGGPGGGIGPGSAGFGSSILPAGFEGENPIGPIGRTELAYGIPTLNLAVYPGLEANGPSLSVNGNPPVGPGQPGVNEPDAVVKENNSLIVPISASLGNNAAAGDHLVVVVSGLPGAGIGTIGQTGGVYDAASGTITYTLPPGQNLSTDLQFTPTKFSDVDFGQLTVTVTQYQTNGATQTASANLYVTTDAVAEVPGLATQHATEEAGHTAAVGITATEVDPDGSEHVTAIRISGLPDGATLNHGVHNSDGSYTLTQADLTGLTVTTTKAVAPGDYTLTVVATSTETNLNGREADYSDNSATATLPLTLSVTPNSIPVITSTGLTPNGDLVQEANLNPATPHSDFVSDHVTVNYGVDGPGAGVAINGMHSASVANLTSGGAAVTISESGNTYTGTANGHEIFTLAVNGDGTYQFTLDGPLDHPDTTNPHDGIALSFGITATDSDGDSATGTITINVIDDAPVAHDDVNTFFTSAGAATGNVISGAGDSNTGGADYQSHDGNNHVTSIAYGTTTDTIVQDGSATIDGKYGELHIDSIGNYTYTLFTTAVSTAQSFTGNSFPTDIVEQQPINAADRADLGVIHSNLSLDFQTTAVTGNIVLNGALLHNSVGSYIIGMDGTLEAAQMIAPSVGGSLDSDPNIPFSVTLPTGATQLGFFLVSDGASVNNGYQGLDFSTGKLAFVYDYGQGDQRTATVNDTSSHISLVFTDQGGHDTILQGNTYFTTDRGGSNALNPDNIPHVISGILGSDPTTLSIGFEDLPTKGGTFSDMDYNDVILNIHLTDASTTYTAGTDTFTYGVTDNDGDTSNATLSFNGETPPSVAITVNGGSPIIGDAGTQVQDAVVKENDHITIPVTATVNNPSSASEALTVVISGIPAGVGGVTAANGGVYDAAHGTVTWSLAPGASLDSSITLTPTQYSDVDFGNLHVSASATDAASGTVTSSANIYVTTDAVAEAPGLTVMDASEEAGHTTGLHITATEIDPDGSESIASVKISGLPDGATLSAGTHNADGSYTLTQDQLNGLQVTTSKNTTVGDYTLTVVATSTETTLSGKEADYTDNSASTTHSLNLHVDSNSVPVIAAPPVLTVYEHDLNPATSVSEMIIVNYGDNAGAGVTATNSFSASVANLTSDGHAVNVTETGNVYTGIADGQTIFTMMIGADGTSTFTLDGTLDHPAAGNDAITLNFGAQAADTYGDITPTTVSVNVIDDVPVANSDINSTFDIHGTTTGNVISGLNGGTGAADYQSHDMPNHVSQIAFGDQVVAVPANGSATIDGQYGELVIHSDGSYGYNAFESQNVVSKNFAGNSFPTDIVEQQPINVADRADLGVIPSNLAVTYGTTEIAGNIVLDGALLHNSVGSYIIGMDGTLEAAQMIAPSVGGSLDSDPNIPFSVTLPTGAAQLGFFLVSDGASVNNGYQGLDFSTGKLAFVYDYGQGDQRTATVNDTSSHISLVFTDQGGHDTILQGNTYFTTDRGGSNALNPDNIPHVISGILGSDPTTLSIGFEDLPTKGGTFSDMDYNDVILNIHLQDASTLHTLGTDQFAYTLIDGDGDQSSAGLTLMSGQTQPTGGTSADSVHGLTISGDHGGTLYGSSGDDTFVFGALNTKSVPVIADFHMAEGDKLDLSALLTKFDPVQNSIDNFVHATSANGNTTIAVDVTGSGQAANFVNVAVLQGVGHVNVDDLLAQHHLVTQAAAA